jgi:hypothetical protein
MEERRQDPRNPVSWLVRVWLRQNWFVIGRAKDTSRRGLGVALSPRIPAGALEPGTSYRVEVRTEHDGELVFVGELRSVTDHGLGFEIREWVSTRRGREREQESQHL